MNIILFVVPCLAVLLSANIGVLDGKTVKEIVPKEKDRDFGLSIAIAVTAATLGPIIRGLLKAFKNTKETADEFCIANDWEKRDGLAEYWGTSGCRSSHGRTLGGKWYCTSTPKKCYDDGGWTEPSPNEYFKNIGKVCWKHKEYGFTWKEGPNPKCGKLGRCCRYDKVTDKNSGCKLNKDGIKGDTNHVCVEIDVDKYE